jgi:NADPH:quinone reductase-like Zn-dependent oxidoreductase
VRAVRYDPWGPPHGLHVVDDIAEPHPGAGEVLVRIEAASLNPVDWKLCAGALRHVPGAKSPPRVTGCDFAGVIAAVGAGVSTWREGDRVFGMLSPSGREGSCAERCVVGAQRIAAIPDGVSFETAACLPIASGEAVQALAEEARLAAGQRLLIVGAAGGVSHFAVQFARHIGARVTGVCGAGNLDFVKRELGADEVAEVLAAMLQGHAQGKLVVLPVLAARAGVQGSFTASQTSRSNRMNQNPARGCS